MPFAAIGRQPILDDPAQPQPDIETMSGWDLEAEVSVCRYYESFHRLEGHSQQAYLWFRRRLRVQELLARAGRATA